MHTLHINHWQNFQNVCVLPWFFASIWAKVDFPDPGGPVRKIMTPLAEFRKDFFQGVLVLLCLRVGPNTEVFIFGKFSVYWVILKNKKKNKYWIQSQLFEYQILNGSSRITKPLSKNLTDSNCQRCSFISKVWSYVIVGKLQLDQELKNKIIRIIRSNSSVSTHYGYVINFQICSLKCGLNNPNNNK